MATTRPVTNESIARAWRAVAFEEHAFVRAETNSPSGVDRGFMVVLASLPTRRVYLKPTVLDSNPGNARAAREKIASDLAFDLGVSVPPVVLTTRRDAPRQHEPHVALSLVKHTWQYHWGQIKDDLNGDHEFGIAMRKGLAEAVAKVVAFNNWVCQTDHNDHPSNIAFGMDREPALNSWVFLDYAMALGWGGLWDQGGWESLGVMNFPARLLPHIGAAQLDATLRRIEEYDAERIRQLVERIPGTHLAHEEGQKIINGLVRRRPLVRQLVAQYL